MNEIESIKARLKNLAIGLEKPYEYIQTHYFIERVLYRISKSRYAGNFVLKGGLLLQVLFDHSARATRDVDLLAKQVSNTPEELKTIMREVCSVQADDGVTFDLDTMTSEIITEASEYPGIRIKTICYLGRSRSTIQFDIGFGDAFIPHAETMVYPSLLKMNEIEILVYSKESIIAEKFHAMVSLAMANSRMKDFYGISMMAEENDFDGSILYAAIRETFSRRGTAMPETPLVFSEIFAQDSDKLIQWQAFLKRTNIQAASFFEVLQLIRRFLQPISEAIFTDSPWDRPWSHRQTAWIS